MTFFAVVVGMILMANIVVAGLKENWHSTIGWLVALLWFAIATIMII